MTEIFSSKEHFLVPGAYFVVALGIVLVALIIREYVAGRVVRALSGVAKNYGLAWDDKVLDSVKRPVSFLILVVGAWLAVMLLRFAEKPLAMSHIVDLSVKIAVILLFGWLFSRLIGVFVADLRRKAQEARHGMDPHLIPVISIALKSVLFVGVFIAVAQTLGYSVSAIVASVGVGGVVVALGARDVAANFFGSVAVMVDKPFRLGDLIRGQGFEGVVEEIGFRSTKIRTDEKTVMVVPNDKLASLVVENVDRRKDEGLNVRMVSHTLGFGLDAGADKLEGAIAAIRELLNSHPMVSRLPLWVNFSDFAESSLDVSVRYFVKTADQGEYLRVRQEVGMKIIRLVEARGLRLHARGQNAPMKKPE
ncbi:MAG: mechanosensitive ion channel [Nitrospinae bacterium]|nr:mechanosensitive ion channel [Nitrospinota bacterium]